MFEVGLIRLVIINFFWPFSISLSVSVACVCRLLNLHFDINLKCLHSNNTCFWYPNIQLEIKLQTIKHEKRLSHYNYVINWIDETILLVEVPFYFKTKNSNNSHVIISALSYYLPSSSVVTHLIRESVDVSMTEWREFLIPVR